MLRCRRKTLSYGILIKNFVARDWWWLAGSVWGDHCSPISDTTILSSMASGCDHIAHVRTQIPYALSVGIVGIVVGNIPTALGVPVWISLAAGIAVVLLGVRFLTKPVETAG